MASRLAIIGGTVVTPGEVIEGGSVLSEDGRIVFVGSRRDASPEPASEIFDATGHFVFPGFIDTHVHGSGGDDVMTNGTGGIEAGAEAIRRVSRAQLKYGVTGYLPTSIAAVRDDLLHMIEQCEAAARAPGLGSDILGYHLEGPFINQTYKGAQPESGIRDPDLDECRDLLDAAPGRTKIMTLAPELPGGIELIRFLRREGVIASLGHSESDYPTALEAIDAGATHATHLYNAMSGLDHRKPGLASACLNEPAVVTELILDGVHVHPKMALLAKKAKGCQNIVIVTDATSAQGCPDGMYKLGNFDVLVRAPYCTLLDETTLAGSVLTMNRAARNAVDFMGAALVEAAYMASLLPARLCGVENERGSIEVHKRADLAIVDREFKVQGTVIGGRLVQAT